MQEINPQVIINELARRLQEETLNNVVLSARLMELQGRIASEETTVIGADTDEE